MSNPAREGRRTRLDSRQGIGTWQLLTMLPWMLAYVILLATAWTLFFRSTPPAAAWIVFALIAVSSLGFAGAVKWLRLRPQPQQIILLALLLVQVSFGLRWLVFQDAGVSLFNILPKYLASILQSGQRVMLLSAAAGIIYLWRKGISAWDEWIGPLSAGRTLRNGILLFFAMGMSAPSLGVRVPIPEFLAYLFAGLLSTGAARLSAQAHQRGGRGVPANRVWILSLAGATVAALAFASGLAKFVGGPVAAVLASTLSAIFRSLLGLLALLLLPIVELLTELWNLLLARLQVGSVEFTPLETDALSELSEQLRMLADSGQPFPWADDLKQILLLIAALIVLGIIAWVVLLTVRRRSALRPVETELEREGLLSGGLLAALRRILPSGGILQRAWEGLNPARRWIAATRIRWIYAQLLRALAGADLKRLPSETPIEFMTRITVQLPAVARDLETITHGYLRVRYGEYAELAADVEIIERSWERVRGSLTARDHQRSYSSIT